MRRILFIMTICTIPLQLLSDGPSLPWVVYYNNQAKPQEFKNYNPIIFDGTHYPDIEPLLKDNKVVLGYISLGEAEDRYEWFSKIKELDLLIGENSDWKGSWAVDIRNPYWTSFLLNDVIPAVFARGFSGIFMDQIDVPLDLERKDPVKYKGMKEAAVTMIKAIRTKYPDKYIMLNRGYELLKEVGGDIDFDLAETLYTTYDFDTKKYSVRPKEEFDWQLSVLNEARFIHPRLVLFSLDYWDPTDVEMIGKIYEVERAEGMRPYVTTPQLNEIYPEPKK